MIARLRTAFQEDALLRYALALYAGVHALLMVWMWLVAQLVPFATSPDPVFRPYMGVTPDPRPVLSVWQRWDALQYQALADGGYAAFENSLFVTPLYPALMKWGGAVLGGDTLLAGWLVSNVFGFFALLAVGRLAEDLFGDVRVARNAMLAFAIFPTAYFLHAPYTEPLFLLGAIQSLRSVHKREWAAAGLWGFLACFARLPGALILVALVWAAARAMWQARDWRALMAPGIASLGALIFPLYFTLWLGDAVTAPWVEVNARYSGSVAFPFWNIVLAAREVLEGPFTQANLVDIAFTLFAIGLIVPVWRRLPRVFSVYYMSFLLAYSIRVAEFYPLLSMPRYVLILFPGFLVVGQWVDRPWRLRVLVYASVIGLLFLSGQFAIWGWVA